MARRGKQGQALIVKWEFGYYWEFLVFFIYFSYANINKYIAIDAAYFQSILGFRGAYSR
jgi:hypothetical protein